MIILEPSRPIKYLEYIRPRINVENFWPRTRWNISDHEYSWNNSGQKRFGIFLATKTSGIFHIFWPRKLGNISDHKKSELSGRVGHSEEFGKVRRRPEKMSVSSFRILIFFLRGEDWSNLKKIMTVAKIIFGTVYWTTIFQERSIVASSTCSMRTGKFIQFASIARLHCWLNS